MTAKPSIAAASLALFALIFLAYLPALHAQFIWDDNDYVTDNLNLRTAAGLGRIWTNPHSDWQYYPLVFTSFWIEYPLWQLSPLGYHLDNILLHGISAVVLWRLLKRLDLPAAWLASAIFAVHPVQVESVAWITERKNILCGLFYFAAMLVYFKRPGRLPYMTALALFTCAMFSKTVAVTWPAAMLVLIWWKSGRVLIRDALALVPFAAVGILLGLTTVQLEHEQVGAVGKYWELSLADRCIVAGRALWFYADKAILPARLTFIYPKWNLNSDRPIQAAVAISTFLVIAGLVLLSKRIGRSPATAALLFAGTLAPALGFFNIYPMRYSYVADHFQYLAIVALIVPIASSAQRAAGRLAFLLLIPLAVMTFLQCRIYHDPVTLWTDTVAKNPDSWMAHVNLGQAFQARSQPDRAEAEYKIATQCQPDEVEAWWKLGAFQADRGEFDEAEANFRRALQVDPNNSWAQYDLRKVLNRRR
jgi:protein O-mannosyl-transferase